MVDYTSLALSTPVTPFPAIGDAAYRQRDGGGLSHGHRQHAQNIGKDRACGSGDILSDKQADRHRHDLLITILRRRSSAAAEVKKTGLLASANRRGQIFHKAL